MKWKELCLPPQATLREALSTLGKAGAQFALVTDPGDILLGVVTDGNVRRGLLAGKGLETPVSEVMHTSPRTVNVGVSARDALRIMEHADFTHLPVVDASNRVVSLWSRKVLQQKKSLPNSMILMVGGLGTRLGELTREMPKPMLPVGGRPMLEIVLRNCMEWGIRHFYMAVNYKAHMVMEHFGDGSQLGCTIEYVQESKRMGTAGALTLLPKRPEQTFFVGNGDVLTHINMQHLLNEHTAHTAVGTMVVRRHVMHVPYGVVERTAQGTLLGIREKPTHEFCVNAGLYALEPEVIDYIPKDTFFDMPELFLKLLAHQKKPFTYETQNYWIDVGQIAEYEQAQDDFLPHDMEPGA